MKIDYSTYSSKELLLESIIDYGLIGIFGYLFGIIGGLFTAICLLIAHKFSLSIRMCQLKKEKELKNVI